MIEYISKPKLPSQYAYALKTQQLERVLADNSIDIPVDLLYSRSQPGKTIFLAHFSPMDVIDQCKKLSISVGVLLKDDAFAARKQMEQIVLPEFIAWITEILSLPKTSPRSGVHLYFTATLKDDKVEISEQT